MGKQTVSFQSFNLYLQILSHTQRNSRDIDSEHVSLLREMTRPDDSVTSVHCSTCTLISFVSDSRGTISHVALIAPGHIASVPYYKWPKTDSKWVISTLHTKQPNFVTFNADKWHLRSPQGFLSDSQINDLPKHVAVHIPLNSSCEPEDDVNSKTETTQEQAALKSHSVLTTVEDVYCCRNLTISFDQKQQTVSYLLKSLVNQELDDEITGKFWSPDVSLLHVSYICLFNESYLLA